MALIDIVSKENVNLKYLAILKPYDIDGAAVETLYYSGEGFITEPTDTPANQFFEPRLVEPISFTRSMFSQGKIGGFSTPGFGNLVLTNADGELDDYANYAWNGREVEIKVGEAGSTYSNYYTIFKGTSKAVEFDDLYVKIILRDQQDDFAIDFPNSFYAGTGGNEGSANLEGKPKPLCFGEVFNIEPVLVDSTNRVYQVHNGAIESVVAVYEGGVALTLTTDYTVDATNGRFTLVADPTQKITADIKGAKPSSTYIDAAGKIIREIVTTYGGLTDPGDLDTAAFTAMETANSSAVGIYINEQRKMQDVLDELANTVGAFYGFDRDGKFTLARIELGSGTADAEYDSTNIIEITRLAPEIPSYRVTVDYKKNNSVMSESDFGASITAAQRDYLVRESLFEVASDSGVVTKYPNSQTLAVPALFAATSPASTEATRLLNIYKVQREIYRIKVKVSPYTLKLNDVVKITFNRYNLASGKLFRVISITEDAAVNEIELELWG
jgi:hypothetical protein